MNICRFEIKVPMYPEHMRKNANLFCVLLTGVCLYRIQNIVWSSDFQVSVEQDPYQTFTSDSYTKYWFSTQLVLLISFDPFGMDFLDFPALRHALKLMHFFRGEPYPKQMGWWLIEALQTCNHLPPDRWLLKNNRLDHIIAERQSVFQTHSRMPL